MKTEDEQPIGSDKKDDDSKKERKGGEIKKLDLNCIKGEADQRGEKNLKGESEEGKLNENPRNSSVQNHIEKDHNENKIRKQNEQKPHHGTPFANKVPNGDDQHKCGKKEEQCGYPSSAYSPRTISLKHYSKSYLTHHNGAQDGIENDNTLPGIKQKWENERQPIQEPPQVYSGSSHFPMTRLSSSVLPHYSNYVHQSLHGNADGMYEYASGYPYRSFMQRHSSQ